MAKIAFGKSSLEARLSRELMTQIGSNLPLYSLVYLSYTSRTMHGWVQYMFHTSKLAVADYHRNDQLSTPAGPMLGIAFPSATLLLKLILRDPGIAPRVRWLALEHDERHTHPFTWHKGSEFSPLQKTWLRTAAQASYALGHGHSASVRRLLRPLNNSYEPADRAMDLLTILLALLPQLRQLLLRIGDPDKESECGMHGFSSCAEMMRRVVLRYDTGDRDIPLTKLRYLQTRQVPIEQMPSLFVMPGLQYIELHASCTHSFGLPPGHCSLQDWLTYPDGTPMLSPASVIIVKGCDWYGLEHTKYIMDRVRGPAVLINDPIQNSWWQDECTWDMNLHYTSATKLGNAIALQYFDYWHPVEEPPVGGFRPLQHRGDNMSWDEAAMQARFKDLIKPWLRDPLPDIIPYIIRNSRLLGLNRLPLDRLNFGDMVDALNALTVESGSDWADTSEERARGATVKPPVLPVRHTG